MSWLAQKRLAEMGSLRVSVVIVAGVTLGWLKASV
jgi:hypothetical protein